MDMQGRAISNTWAISGWTSYVTGIMNRLSDSCPSAQLPHQLIFIFSTRNNTTTTIYHWSLADINSINQQRVTATAGRQRCNCALLRTVWSWHLSKPSAPETSFIEKHCHTCILELSILMRRKLDSSAIRTFHSAVKWLIININPFKPNK